MNIVILTGRLASAPEVKTSQGGKQYANASMVVHDSTDKYSMTVDLVVFERNLPALMSNKQGSFIQIIGKLNVYSPKETGQSSRSGKQTKVIVDTIVIPIERSVATQDSGSYQPQPGRNGGTGTAPAAVATPPETDFDPFEN